MERRKIERKSVNYPGLIVAEGQSIRQCIVVDVSAGGAKLMVRNIESLPSRFKLMWSHAENTGFDCEVRWRDPGAVGVEFVSGQNYFVVAIEALSTRACGSIAERSRPIARERSSPFSKRTQALRSPLPRMNRETSPS